MGQTSEIRRRLFLKGAAAAACGTTVHGAWAFESPGSHSEGYKLVAQTDRKRILDAAAAYVSQEPVTLTAFPAQRSAGGPHDFYSQADYFWPDPKNPDGPYVNRDGQSNPDNFNEHRRVMVAFRSRCRR